MNEPRKFLNQAQPQTLVIATVLLYLNAFFNMITFFLPLLVLGAAMAAGGFGVANEKRWGYGVAVSTALLNLGLLLLIFRGSVFEFPVVLNLIFDAGLVGLLLHPESRDYQRIWFR